MRILTELRFFLRSSSEKLRKIGAHILNILSSSRGDTAEYEVDYQVSIQNSRTPERIHSRMSDFRSDGISLKYPRRLRNAGWIESGDHRDLMMISDGDAVLWWREFAITMRGL